MAERSLLAFRVAVLHRESVCGDGVMSRSPLCTVAGACAGPFVGPSRACRAGARASSSGLEQQAGVFVCTREMALEEVSVTNDVREQCEYKCDDLTHH